MSGMCLYWDNKLEKSSAQREGRKELSALWIDMIRRGKVDRKIG